MRRGWPRRYHPNDPLCPDPDDEERRESAAERLDDLDIELERTRRVNEGRWHGRGGGRI